MGNQWVMTQIGAREHYALPRALNRLKRLGRLYTELWAGPVLRSLRRGPAPLRALAARSHNELPTRLVTGFNRSTLWCTLEKSRRRSQTLNVDEQFLQHIAIGRRFANQVCHHLEQNWSRFRPAGLIGYDTGCLETQHFLADRGIPSLVDQIDPARVEQEIVTAEVAKWPGWQSVPGQIPEAYYQRLEDEWVLATKVIVNSEWSKEALIRQGVPASKLVVLPLCFEADPKIAPSDRSAERIKTVLWLGQVILRKGIQYLIEAAKLLVNQPIEFLVAGPIGISDDAVRSAPANVRFLGSLTRDRVTSVYRQADLFVLPTLSDGFALTQLEAMAHGLPVIATPNCGRVVTDGEDGRIVAAGDAEQLASAIEALVGNPRELKTMSARARKTVGRYSMAALIERITPILDDAMNSPQDRENSLAAATASTSTS